MKKPEHPELEARRLREAIYGGISDASWDQCAGMWVGELEWLRANQPVHRAPCPVGMHWKSWNGIYGNGIYEQAE